MINFKDNSLEFDPQAHIEPISINKEASNELYCIV